VKNGGLHGAEGIDFGPDGDLYVANDLDPTNSNNPGPGDVLVYKGTTGKFLGVFVDNGVGGMGRGNDLHWGPDGNLYVDNTEGAGQILRYDAQGNPLPSGSRDEANFTDPVPGHFANGFTFGPNGYVYVAEDNPARTRGEVLQYDVDGNLLGTFIPESTAGLGFIDGVRFGPNGDLYVTDLANHRILEFSGQDGSFVGVFVAPGSGGLVNPAGLLFYDDRTSASTAATHDGNARTDAALEAVTFALRHSDPVAVPPGSTNQFRDQVDVDRLVGDAQVARTNPTGTLGWVLPHHTTPTADLSGLPLSGLELGDLQ
jgi:hypothetical protein